MTPNKLRLAAVLNFLVFFTGTMRGQVATPDSGLTYSGLIPVPNWTTGSAGVDLNS